MWSGANKAVQEDTNSTFGNVVSDTGAKYSVIKAAWLETAPEIVDLKAWVLTGLCDGMFVDVQ